MKLVPIEAIDKAAPSDLFLVLTSGLPYYQQDGCEWNTDAPRVLPCIPAGFRLDHSEMMQLSAKPLNYPDIPGRFQTSVMHYHQFVDVIKVLGFHPDAITVPQLRIVLHYSVYITYALNNWVDLMDKIVKHPGSLPHTANAHTVDMIYMGLLVMGWVGSKPHMMLTPKGYRLAKAIRNLSLGLLSGAMPEQYVSSDFKSIEYPRLWNERQGTVCQVMDEIHGRLDNYIGDL